MLLLDKNSKFNKNEAESKMENLMHSFREMKHVLAIEKKRAFFAMFLSPKKFFYCFRFISVYGVFNKLSEYIYFDISENITSHTFVASF